MYQAVEKSSIKRNGAVKQLESYVQNKGQNYSYTNGTSVVGDVMEAWLDPSKMLLGQSANINTSQDEMMNDIRAYWNIKGGDVVKGHLLNDNMGGTALNTNLFPITRAANKDHLSYVENAVKNRIWNDQSGMYYKISVNANPTITEPEADFDCVMKEWNPATNTVGKDLMPPVTIPSDLRNVRNTGQAFVTHDGQSMNPVKRPKKPSWATAPKKRVGDLTTQEYDDRDMQF